MTDPPPRPPPLKLVAIGTIEARVLREEARGFRMIAAELLCAELAADWTRVAVVRTGLVENAHKLEASAARHDTE